MNFNILIVDDEEDIRNLIKGILEDEGYSVSVASNSSSAYDLIKEHPPSLVILDIWLRGSEDDGLEILSCIKKDYPYIPVIMISGHGTIETAVSSIKQGAYDFIEKPFKSNRLLLMIQRALETAQLRRENEELKQKVDVPQDFVGNSSVIQQLKQVIERAASTNSRVLLTGEAGAGKNVAARIIHNFSERKNNPFLILNCATLISEHLEVELFGSIIAGGSKRTGILEQVNGGTLFLDEVADMPLETQGKIVRILQEQHFQKVGDDKIIDVDVRILSSTNKNLEQMMEAGKFRKDLYYRLNVVPIHIPSLREHIEDIPALVSYILKSLNKQTGLPLRSFSDDALNAMQSYYWPGNVRQLRNVIEWILIMYSNKENMPIIPENLPPEIYSDGCIVSSTRDSQNISMHMMELSLRKAREMFEKEYLESQVNRFSGNISKTAKFIGMERSALHRKLKSLQILNNEKEISSIDETQNEIRKRA
ncbi:MAG: sigma-54-dependent Fis family transcriptional regulator [Alphaproteobacteria bacterium]|nr:sigma-54-dependent Fis family transcriptional regulator [Alphaproteobacteria bacterium]